MTTLLFLIIGLCVGRLLRHLTDQGKNKQAAAVLMP